MQVSRRWVEDFTVHDLSIPKYNCNTLDIPPIFHKRKTICCSIICLNVTTHVARIWFEQENEIYRHKDKTLEKSKITFISYTL